MNETGGWGAYERLVLAKLEELADDIKDVNQKLDDNIRLLNQKIDEEVKEIRKEQTRQDVSIAMLNVRSGVWGAAAAILTVGVYIAYALLSGSGTV